MQLILHTGAHFTDRERLLKCLLNNKEDFSRRAVSVPGPGRYRTLLKEALVALDDNPTAAPDAREILLDAILDAEQPERTILSNQNFFGSPRFALGGNRFYPLATRRLQQFHQLFPGDQIQLFMGTTAKPQDRRSQEFRPAVGARRVRGSPEERSPGCTCP